MKDRIKQLRKYFHLTQQELADKTGVTRGFISQVETDRSGLSDENIGAFCKALHISAAWLQYGIEPMESDNPEDWIPKEKEKEQFEPVAERVRELRDKLDLSQLAFAEKMGCSRELIALVEQKRIPASRKLIIKIEETYNVSHDWLMNGNGDIFLSEEKPEEEKNEDNGSCECSMKDAQSFKCLEYIFPSITDQHRKGYLIINDIPCKRCEKCGRVEYTEETEEKLERMVKDLFPVFSLNRGFESPGRPGASVGDTIIQMFDQ